jgi:hypothetical protein
LNLHVVGWIVGAFLVSSCDRQTGSPPTPAPAPTPAPVHDTRVATYELQEKCAKDSAAWYKHWWEDPKGLQDLVSNYTNHYNQKSGRCFLVVASTMFSKASKTRQTSSINAKTLVDVLENRDIGTLDTTSLRPQPIQCQVGGISCASSDEWDARAKPYMED